MKLELSYDVVIRPPSFLTCEKWGVHLLMRQKMLLLPDVGAYILFQVRNYPDIYSLIDAVEKKYQLNHDKVHQFIKKLIDFNILVDASDSSHKSLLKHQSLDETQWAKEGSLGSGEYHRATFDYPFYDYSEGGDGYLIQQQNMLKYAAESPDTNRFRENYTVLGVQSLPSPGDTHFNQDDEIHQLIRQMLSLVFLPTGTKAVPYSQVPLIRRTSPSGGGRHPIEGYWIEPSGIVQHIFGKDQQLRVLGKSPDLIPQIVGTNNKGTLIGIVVLTCVFERNSFRYRESRTFRTVHMDAGHFAASVSMLAETLGFYTEEHWIEALPLVEEALQIDGFSEFLVASISIWKR